MTEPKRSLRKRLIVGQIFVVVSFALLTTGNLIWQFYGSGRGDLDVSSKASATAFLTRLSANQDYPTLLRRDAQFLEGFIRESMTLDWNKNSANELDLQLIIRVLDKNREEVFRSKGFEQLALPAPDANPVEFIDAGDRWRVITATNQDQSLTAQFALSSNLFLDATVDIIGRFILLPLFLFLPFAGLLSWFIAVRNIEPVKRLAEIIGHRSAKDLTPLSGVPSYEETDPLVNEINSLLRKVDSTLSRERVFLANAAHELRTPLAVVQAQAHVLRCATDEAEKAAATDELNAGVARAASLIQKLLLTARFSVEDFVPRYEFTDLTSFVQDRIATFSALAAQKRIEMALEAPHACHVNIDRESFGCAIDNVLDNAIRYTPDAGTILIEIAPIDGQVELRIADNGLGVPVELHERVFERFFRVAGTEQEGSGLGLAIAKQVMTLHGGKVSLSGGLDLRGLAVCLTIPCRA